MRFTMEALSGVRPNQSVSLPDLHFSDVGRVLALRPSVAGRLFIARCDVPIEDSPPRFIAAISSSDFAQSRIQ